MNNFELASQRSTPEEESKRLLHVVIVGGGPTGVEFGAEIYDFVEQVGPRAGEMGVMGRVEPSTAQKESKRLLHSRCRRRASRGEI